MCFLNRKKRKATFEEANDEFYIQQFRKPPQTFRRKVISRLLNIPERGAASNVMYLHSYPTERLTGPEAMRKCVLDFLMHTESLNCIVSFQVDQNGIVLTDIERKIFLRKRFRFDDVSFCEVVVQENFSLVETRYCGVPLNDVGIFGLIAKDQTTKHNRCFLFKQVENEAPASAIVKYVNQQYCLESISPQNCAELDTSTTERLLSHIDILVQQ